MVVAGCEQFCLIVGGFSCFWLVVGGFGRLWVVFGDYMLNLMTCHIHVLLETKGNENQNVLPKKYPMVNSMDCKLIDQ